MTCPRCNDASEQLIPTNKNSDVCFNCFAQLTAEALSRSFGDGSKYTAHVVKKDK
jgi:hypothetical protein